jgi:hypothetical protein
LLKTILKKYAMELSKIAEHPEIRAVHLRNEHERQVFTAASLDLPGTENASAVGIDQDRNNQPGVISVLAFNLIAVFNGRGVKLLKKLCIEIAFMIFRKQIENITGKQEVLIKFNWA